jgi:hypothetical protein
LFTWQQLLFCRFLHDLEHKLITTVFEPGPLQMAATVSFLG